MSSLLDQETTSSEVDVQAPLMELGLDSLATTQLVRQLGTSLSVQLPPTLLFDYPTVDALSDHLVSEVWADNSANDDDDAALKSVHRPMQRKPLDGSSHEVAIVGMNCRLPGGVEGPSSLWDVVTSGSCTVDKVPFSRWDVDAVVASNPSWGDDVKSRVQWGGFVEDLELFDASFFRISAAEAIAMDPQQRLVLEYSYLALQDAGYDKDDLGGTNCGVFLGIEQNDAMLLLQGPAATASLYSTTGVPHSTAAGRVSFVFGLQGPCSAFDAACASSVVALHAAARCLQHGDCDLAVVAGVKANLVASGHAGTAIAGMTSSTGRCHTFDEAADGYVRSEGCGALVLKRLVDAVQDSNQVHATVRGVSVAQDGTSASLTAPNGRAQEKLIRTALDDAGLSGAEVDYLEAHGTGTPLGDPIEMGAVARVMGENRGQDCPLVMGAVKANLGHMESASGMAGLVKAVLVMQHEQAPANAELKSLNPKIAAVIEGFPVRFPTALGSLTGGGRGMPLLAGLSSFGFNGSISHAVLRQAPKEHARRPESGVGDCHVEETKVSGTSGATTPPTLLFLFTGQGSQYESMGGGLYEIEPVVRDALYRCEVEFARITGESLLEVMYPEKERYGTRSGDVLAAVNRLDQTRCTQPALFALEWSLAELWRSRGVVPGAVLGHSVGEIAAACVAGVMTMETGMQLVVQRSRLMQVGAGEGGKGSCDAG